MGGIMNNHEKYLKELKDERYSVAYHRALEELSEAEIDDCYYTQLNFGTAGIRGKIGVGPNRMHEYKIRQVSYAFAQYLLEQEDNPSVVIGFDSRNTSEDFSKIAASTFATNGVLVYRFNQYCATPELSFSVRELSTTGGVVITASHNPPEYNGYKAYHATGRQVLEPEAERILYYYDQVEDVFDIKIQPYDKLLEEGKIIEVGDELFAKYDEAIQSFVYEKNEDIDVTTTYTALHGVGKRGVLNALKSLHVTVYPVKKQIEPDGNFPTANIPNPEDPSSFELSITEGLKHDCDLLIATDPDADRLGVMIRQDGEYTPIDGNEMGILMLDYLIRHRKQVQGAHLISTVVSNLLIDKIADRAGVQVTRTLTGFKYMGDQVTKIKEKGEEFLLAFEESYGYVHGDHVRDKDGINATTLVIEMANECKKRGVTLRDRLFELYEEYGYYLQDMIVLKLEGRAGIEKIAEIMKAFRSEEFSTVLGKKLVSRVDYLHDQTPLAKSNVLRFIFEDDLWFAIRPSGTEPKLKIYFGVAENSIEEANQQLQEFSLFIDEYISKF